MSSPVFEAAIPLSERPSSQTRIAVPRTVASELVRTLTDAGVRHAFGLIGGAVAPIAHALNESAIELVHFRHESGAAFAAIEAWFASGRPVVVFTTAGPGLANVVAGMAAARWEGAKVVLISPATAPANRGRRAFQETHGFDVRGLAPGESLFDYSALVDDPAALAAVAPALARGLARPGPFLAHVQISIAAQTAPAPSMLRAVRHDTGPLGCAPAMLDRVVDQLAGRSFVLWVGAGAARCPEQVRRFAEATRAPVMSTPRGKGIFPEGHPLYLGVTGLGGHAAVDEYLAAHRPDCIVVLGSRLGEMTSFWDRRMLPRERLIHVDVDETAFGGAYPDVATTALVSDAGELLDGLLERARGRLVSRAPAPSASPFGAAPAPRSGGPVRARVLMASLQRVLDARGEVPVLAEAGNSFAWTTHSLRFSRPVHRASTGFGSMGHATCGVVGAAIAAGGKAIAVVGDGAMLMNSEVSTAVEHRVPAVWIVLNDSQYGMIEQGMRSVGLAPFATRIPRADFASIARAVGARGLRVRSELELDAALAEAMDAAGPFVVDVDLAGDEDAPTRKRNSSLIDQGIAQRTGDES
ncbi:MAG: thiamine pyrophosphate-binding protein [Deltaproteobacteria bacterium]|nr:thiamine pyrophosphate-binding protein [Deltaproteobacteria bacterium]